MAYLSRPVNPLRIVFRTPLDEEALCMLLKRRRMRLPKLALNAWFPDADDVSVSISALPKGGWSSPVVDMVFLAKLVRLLQPRRILELGSYRGYNGHAPRICRASQSDVNDHLRHSARKFAVMHNVAFASVW